MVLVVKKLAANAGDARDVGSIPESGDGNTSQYSCWENSREAWQATVCGAAESQKQLSTSDVVTILVGKLINYIVCTRIFPWREKVTIHN